MYTKNLIIAPETTRTPATADTDRTPAEERDAAPVVRYVNETPPPSADAAETTTPTTRRPVARGKDEEIGRETIFRGKNRFASWELALHDLLTENSFKIISRETGSDEKIFRTVAPPRIDLGGKLDWTIFRTGLRYDKIARSKFEGLFYRDR